LTSEDSALHQQTISLIKHKNRNLAKKNSMNTAFSPNPIANANAPPMNNFNDGGAREFLSNQKWPPGLQETFVKNVSKVAYRVFICDDSGSMATTDGNRLMDTNGHKQ
jgi:hypothetical protein